MRIQATFSRRSPPLDIDHSKILNFSEKEAVTEHTLIRMAKRMRIHVYSLITAGAEEKFGVVHVFLSNKMKFYIEVVHMSINRFHVDVFVEHVDFFWDTRKTHQCSEQ